MSISPDKQNELLEFLDSDNFGGTYNLNEDMCKHTSYKIGGPAAFFVECETGKDVMSISSFCNAKNIDWIVLGGGTNVLVSDEGYDGVIVRLGRAFKNVDFDADTCTYNVGGSANLATLVNDAYKNGRSGLEFAKGIPGSLGGAVFMNAGTGSDWICNRINRVKILSPDGNVDWISANSLDWGYRTSSLTNEHIVLAVEIVCSQLEDDESIARMRAAMDESIARRKKSQPQGVGTCGSVFKNPVGDSAGRLIEECGLKGYRVGGASVSMVHANFIVNDKDACAHDIISIMKLAQQKVYDKFGVKLTPEVKFLGYSEYPVLFK